MRWNAVFCAAALALPMAASPAGDQKPPPRSPASSSLTPDEIDEFIADHAAAIRTIPKEFYADVAKLHAFVERSPRFEDAKANPKLYRILSVLAGVGRDNREQAHGARLPDGERRERRERAQEGFLRDLERQMPDAAWVPGAAGEYAFKRRDYRTAFEDYRRAYELDPRDIKLLLGYGGSAYHLGDTVLSAQAAEKALEMQPGNQEAVALQHFSKDRAPTVQLPSVFGEMSEARAAPAALPSSSMTPEQAAAAAKAQPPVQGPAVERSALFTKEAANALRMRDYHVAYAQASHAIELNAQNAQALNYRAVALTHLNRYQDAVIDASAALALAPGNATILQTRSRAFSHEGKYHEGLKDADETLLRDAANAFAYESKAFALAGLRDNAGAIEALRAAARIDPRFTGRLERALQLPQDGDLTLLFDDHAAASAAPAAAPVPSPGSRPKRFLRLVVLTAVGGLLIALGILHVVSASWREKVNMTVRRVLGPSAAGGPAEAASAPMTGAFWTQYELVKEIGLGGMGVVYEALDRSLERRVAVKKMRDEIRLDPQDRQRFVREAKMVAQLHHPNIVDIYGIVEDGPEIYLVFEFVEGLTLHDALKSSGAMDLTQAKRVLKEMAAAVEHAHEKGVIHRDLKPSNVMLAPDGRVKVMDFGVARQAKDTLVKLSMTNTVVGTPPYMAPEQEQGTVRKESDVYALGICLYEMLTGALPFAGSGAAMLLNKLNGKHVPPSQRVPALSAELDKVIARALAADPEKRYKTPAELIAALEDVPSV